MDINSPFTDYDHVLRENFILKHELEQYKRIFQTSIELREQFHKCWEVDFLSMNPRMKLNCFGYTVIIDRVPDNERLRDLIRIEMHTPTRKQFIMHRQLPLNIPVNEQSNIIAHIQKSIEWGLSFCNEEYFIDIIQKDIFPGDYFSVPIHL